MKRYTLFFLFSILLSSPLFAQNEANNWFFGNSSGVTFSSGTPASITTGALSTYEGTTSASDPITGNLLFYSDGVNVWDNTNTIMPNGIGLLGCSSTTMSALAVPQPGHRGIYYLFTADCIENSGNNGFNYSIVDMSANGGLGDVTSANNLLFTPSGEINHAVKHTNCIDYWIVARETLNNRFRTYLLTDSGVSAPVISSLGVSALPIAWGQGKFSPDGSKFAVADGTGGTVQLFDCCI